MPSSPCSADIFALIAPYLSLADVMRCTLVCKEWKSAPKYFVVKHTMTIHHFPVQLSMLRRLKVEGLKIFSRRDVNRFLPLYNEFFAHTKELRLWVEEESVLRLTNSSERGRASDQKLMTTVRNRAEELLVSMATGISFHSLQRLEIGNLVLSPRACELFATALLSMPALQKLQLHYLVFTDGNDRCVWDAMHASAKLENLRIVIAKGQTAFQRVPPNLKSLDVHRIGLTGANAVEVIRSLPVHSIESVMIHGFWNDLRAAETVSFNYSQMRFAHFPTMHTLQLQNVDMLPVDLQMLLHNLPSTLNRLIVACNMLGGNGLSRAFADGAVLPTSLKWLDLSSNFLTTRDIRCGVVPHCMKNIETLILDGNDEMFGRVCPSPVHTMVFCDVVRAHSDQKTLKRISCKNCGWDELNPATRQPMYPELLGMTVDVAAWRRV